MAQPETILVGQISRAIEKRHPSAYVVKIAGGPYQSGGLPDLAVILRGRYYGFEVKKRRTGESEAHARERATVRQRQRIASIRAAGGVADVVLSVEEALALLPDS
jgi:hypothetical protein